MTAVKGYAQIALRVARQLDEPRLAQYLEMINVRSDELAYLMDSLLDTSRLQSGRLTLERDTFILNDLVAKVVRYFEFDLQRQQRSIRMEVPQLPISVTWDFARIERTLINLIGNAVKYSPSDGEVTVQVGLLPKDVDGDVEFVEIAVTDHGIGIPESERERVFERFYRVRESVEGSFKGTGLGLYISRRIVAGHGGRIWISDALHGQHGTTVHVVMPRWAS